MAPGRPDAPTIPAGRDPAGLVLVPPGAGQGLTTEAPEATDEPPAGECSDPLAMPVSAEHMALLETGEVLVYQGGPDAHLRDTATGETEAVPTPHEAAPNCAGLATLADGRLLTVSGDEEGGPAEVVERLVPGSVDGWPTSGPRRARDGLLPGLHLLPAATSCGPV